MSQKIIRQMLLHAKPEAVWETLTHPEKTKLFMFNCEAITNWEPGSTIKWVGNFQGYESGERGVILENIQYRRLKYTSFDPNFGLDDEPENYLHILYELQPAGDSTNLTTTIENFNGDEQRTKHIAKGWDDIVLPAISRLCNKDL